MSAAGDACKSEMERTNISERRADVDGCTSTLDSIDLSIGEVLCMAFTNTGEGEWYACTASALYSVSSDGVPTLLAGHKTETGFEDGRGSEVWT